MTQIIHLLSEEEREEYAVCKIRVKRGFNRALRALKTIRDKRLYREEYNTFEEFCQAELGRTRQHINRLIKAHTLEEEFGTFGSKNSIEHESWARALASLNDPLEQKMALMLAYSAAPSVIPSGKPTAALIETSVETVKEAKATGSHVDLDGEMLAATASVVVKHNQRVKDAIQDTQEKRGTSEGTVVIVLKHEGCRIARVESPKPRVTFEFEDYDAYRRIMELFNSGAKSRLEMKLTQHYEGQAIEQGL